MSSRHKNALTTNDSCNYNHEDHNLEPSPYLYKSLADLVNTRIAMAQATSDEDYDAEEEKRRKRKKVHHAARTSQRRQKRKQEHPGKEQERQTKRKIINNASRARDRKEKRKQKQAAKKQEELKQQQILQQEQEETKQEKLNQQEIRKAEEEFWNNPDLNIRELDLSTHEPPEWWLLKFEQNPNAAMYVVYAMMGPAEDTRRAPHFNFPAGYAAPTPQTCESCAMFKLSDILERLRINPEYVSLNYLAKQQDIEMEQKSISKWNGMKLFTESGFTRSADGKRLIWLNTAKNRLKLSKVTDALAVFIDAYRIKDNSIEILIDVVKHIDIGPNQLDTGICEHVRDRLETLTCMNCSIRLIWLILDDIMENGNASEFCVLKYAQTRKLLNGYKHGLDLMMMFGFLRSKDGHRFIWKGGETANEMIARHHQAFANQVFCDCELTDDAIASIISAETQEEDQNDERPAVTSDAQHRDFFKNWKQRIDDAARSTGTFRVIMLGLPTPGVLKKRNNEYGYT